MENFTDKIACVCLLEKLQEIEPNINNQFEAYGVLCQRFYNKYKEGDLRRDWAIAPYYNQNVTIAPPNPRLFYNATAGKQDILNRQVGKWRREYEPLGAGLTVKPGWGTQFNFPLLRYADVLLMQAEAEYMINGSSDLALSAINQVSRRAYGFDPLTPNVKSDFSTITLADIQDERQRELCFEVNRKGDLVRWGIYLQRIQDFKLKYQLKLSPPTECPKCKRVYSPTTTMCIACPQYTKSITTTNTLCMYLLCIILILAATGYGLKLFISTGQFISS
jgi:hypothetical protein